MIGLLGGAASLLGLPGLTGAGGFLAGRRSGGDGGYGLFGNRDAPYGYTQLGSPEDVSNVNPYSDAYMNQLQGQGQNVWNQLMQQSEGLGSNQFWPGMQQAIGNIDPQAAQNYFANNAAGQYRDIANQNYEQFNTANQQVADRLSNQAVGNISSQFANRGPGSLRSGGAMQAIGEGAINPLLQSNAQIGQMIGGQAGQLQGQGMNNLFSAYNTANQQRLSGLGALMDDATRRALAGQQTMAGLYGNLLGQQGAMAAPEYWQPTYGTNPLNPGLGDILSAGGQIAGGLMSSGIIGGGGGG